MKSTFLVDPDSGGAVVVVVLLLLLRFGVPVAKMSLDGESVVLVVGRRLERRMDFKPWKVGRRDDKLGLLGLGVVGGMAGSGFELVIWWADLVGRAEVLVGSGGRGRIDFVLSKRTRPICFGADEGGAVSSDDVGGPMAALKDLTLFDRGRREILPGNGRGSWPVVDRASDALVGVSNGAGRPLFGRGRIDGLDAAVSSSFKLARPAQTSPNVDFLLFAGESFSSRSDPTE